MNYYEDVIRVLTTPYQELTERHSGITDSFGNLKTDKSNVTECFHLALLAKRQKWFFTTTEVNHIAESISELIGNIPATSGPATIASLIRRIVRESSILNESEAPVNVSAADAPLSPEANIKSPDILMKPPKTKKKLCGYDKVTCESITEINMFPTRPTLYICGNFKLLVGV